LFFCFIKGAYAKKFYAGIVLDQLDTDDYTGECKCGLFPVTNLAIDGWTGCPFRDCSKLNENKLANITFSQSETNYTF